MKNKYVLALLIMFIGSISLCRGQEISTSVNEVSDFDVESAMSNMQELKQNLDQVTKQLYILDEKERGTDNAISDKYRATRKEIVNVIQTINDTSTTITDQLEKIVTYKKLMLLSYKDIQSSRS
ncbi:MAG: hypothetical protein WCH65_04855 [bacterium]